MQLPGLPDDRPPDTCGSELDSDTPEVCLQQMASLNEQLFRTFADTVPVILWTTDPAGSVTFFSRGWFEFSGQTSEEALGFGWLNAVYPDDRDAASSVLEPIKRGEEFSLDCRVRRTDGVYRWVVNSGRPRFQADGTIAGYTGAIIDIHERKLASQASALLRAIVDSSDDAIISKDLNGVIMSWNKSAERLFGYTADQAVGRSIVMLIPPERLDEEPQILERLKRGERVDHFETIRMRKDGTRLHISLTISPVKDSDGRIVGASKIARDITNRVKQEAAVRDANAALEHANVALQKANADLEHFAYSASHDLQEPLRMVVAYSELLQKRFGGKLGQIGDEYLTHAVQGAMRMEALLQGLRIYMQSFISDGEPSADVDAGAVLDKALANLEAAIRASGARISRTPLPSVRVFDFELQQVFQNLIGNAIRYRGQEPPLIRISAEEQDNAWQFSIQDNGIGIDPRYHAQIFEVFRRLHSANEYPGAGMGLAICKRIIERSGGRIWVKSEPGPGATFSFTVPKRNSAHGSLQRDDMHTSPEPGQPDGHEIPA